MNDLSWVTYYNQPNDLTTVETEYMDLINPSSKVKQRNRCEQMITIQQECLELFKNKNADYGDAFAEYGATGVIIRMGDKLKRFASITKTGVNLVDSESLRDTLIDLHNYSAMAIMLLDEK
jgi:predicted amino acid racemase